MDKQQQFRHHQELQLLNQDIPGIICNSCGFISLLSQGVVLRSESIKVIVLCIDFKLTSATYPIKAMWLKVVFAVYLGFLT